MAIGVAEQIRSVQGVAAAAPQIQMTLGTQGGITLGVNESLLGAVAGSDEGLETFALAAVQGRMLTAADEGTRVAVIGSVLADKHGAEIGDAIELRDVDFEVVGILEPTLTAPDYTAYIPLAAAQEILAETLPSPVRAAISEQQLISQVIVYPSDGIGTDALAADIEASVDNVTTLTASTYNQQYGSAATIFNAILVGIAVISLVVGGLSVINTMAMSIAERTREIGIKRAIGGTRGRIVRELVTEAAVIGLIGGLLGLAFGSLVVYLANESGRTSGTVLFSLTPGTALFAVAFSTVLGTVAGLIPSWSAARLDPVQALRYE